MSFNMNGGPPTNGVISRGSSFGAYGEIDGQQQASQQYGHTAKPQIYTVSKVQHGYVYVWYTHMSCTGRLFERVCI